MISEHEKRHRRVSLLGWGGAGVSSESPWSASLDMVVVVVVVVVVSHLHK